MSLLFVTQRTINGRNFEIRPLPFGDARQVYARLQKLLALHGDETVTQAGCGLFMFAGLIGAVDDDALEFFVSKFGPTTTVDLNATQTLDLGTDEKRTAVFTGAFDDCLAWLDACVEVNFAGVIAKLGAAKTSLEAAAAKAKPKTAKPKI